MNKGEGCVIVFFILFILFVIVAMQTARKSVEEQTPYVIGHTYELIKLNDDNGDYYMEETSKGRTFGGETKLFRVIFVDKNGYQSNFDYSTSAYNVITDSDAPPSVQFFPKNNSGKIIVTIPSWDYVRFIND